MISNLNFMFVTIFGLGKIKLIPGTFGSLACIIILYCLIYVFHISLHFIIAGLIIILLCSFFSIEMYIKKIHNKDPKEIVIDELIGQAIPILAYEISHGTKKNADDSIIYYFICFILFRFFDILKPFPVSFFDEKFKNSFGVIMDDVFAGLYVTLSLICLVILKNYFNL